MNKKIIMALVLVGVLPLNFSQAGPPVAPFVKKPQPGSAWVVEIDYFGGTKKKPAAEDKGKTPAIKPAEEPVTVTPIRLSMKSGKNRVTNGTVFYSNGTSETFYVTAGTVLSKASNSGRIIARGVKASESDYFSLRVEYFPGVTWINRDTYVRTEERNGVECWRFSFQEVSGGGTPGTKLDAWVRTSDRHPLEVHIDEVVYRFGEVVPFDENIQLPAEFDTTMERRRIEQAALELIRNPRQRQVRAK